MQELGVKLETNERETAEMEKKLTGERDETAAKLHQLQETHDVLLSEMASVQSDLATATSQTNTHRLAAEKVSV